MNPLFSDPDILYSTPEITLEIKYVLSEIDHEKYFKILQTIKQVGSPIRDYRDFCDQDLFNDIIMTCVSDLHVNIDDDIELKSVLNLVKVFIAKNKLENCAKQVAVRQIIDFLYSVKTPKQYFLNLHSTLQNVMQVTVLSALIYIAFRLHSTLVAPLVTLLVFFFFSDILNL